MKYENPKYLTGGDRVFGGTLPNMWLENKPNVDELSPDQVLARRTTLVGLHLLDIAFPATSRELEADSLYKRRDRNGKGRSIVHAASLVGSGLIDIGMNALTIIGADYAYNSALQLPHGDAIASGLLATCIVLLGKFGANTITTIGADTIQHRGN